jgi:hypothetical protein
LNIVGAGSPTDRRVVRVWDALQLNEAIFRQDDDWVRITGDRNNPYAYNKGLAAKQLYAHDKLCIGGTCIDESHLKMLTGNTTVAIKRAANNWSLGIDNSGRFFPTTNFGCGSDGCYESFRFVKK